VSDARGIVVVGGVPFSDPVVVDVTGAASGGVAWMMKSDIGWIPVIGVLFGQLSEDA